MAKTETEAARVGSGSFSTDEIIEKTKIALAYLEDGARETGLKRLRELVLMATSYWPLVNLATGREAPPALGAVLLKEYTRLEPTGRAGVFAAPDGTVWVGCTDGIWRQQ